MRAIILLSGGLDSATVLAQAVAQSYQCYALTIDYGQRHEAELAAASTVAAAYEVVEHRFVHIDYGQFGGSALTDPSIEVPQAASVGVPVTYVPARNTIMLSIALGWAEVVAASDIFVGVNAVDYSGYPDCRPEYIAAFQNLARLATKAGIDGAAIRINAPLIALSKSAIVTLGTSLGVDYTHTVSCYQADTAGRACGLCDACRLRREGFDGAGLADPTRYCDPHPAA